jgi:hypothetical protein
MTSERISISIIQSLIKTFLLNSENKVRMINVRNYVESLNISGKLFELAVQDMIFSGQIIFDKDFNVILRGDAPKKEQVVENTTLVKILLSNAYADLEKIRKAALEIRKVQEDLRSLHLYVFSDRLGLALDEFPDFD